MIASSINTGNSRDTKARNDPENGVRIRPWLGKLLRCADADELAHAPAIAELDDAAYLGEQRVVFADTDVGAGLNAVPRWRTMIEPPGTD
jgi:hypothetical protein